jgi:hypothetical protein
MKTVEQFTKDLDILLSDIAFSGLKNVHPGVLEKLSLFESSAQALGMGQGAALIARFSASLKAYRQSLHSPNDPTAQAGRDLCGLLASLDFYNKNVGGNME